jgi:hypothetical protein
MVSQYGQLNDSFERLHSLGGQPFLDALKDENINFDFA